MPIRHPVTLGEAKGLGSSQPRCFAECILSAAEGLSMTCFMLYWYQICDTPRIEEA
ncbi:MAG: hypothetical protein MI924_39615 [Chloroflexales bacterium]|nr:hypothetical protein [Chloroflexales bacterium]